MFQHVKKKISLVWIKIFFSELEKDVENSEQTE